MNWYAFISITIMGFCGLIMLWQIAIAGIAVYWLIHDKIEAHKATKQPTMTIERGQQ